MNAGSVIVLAGVLLLVAFTVWRNLRKGAPCSCGHPCRECGCAGGAGCTCHCEQNVKNGDNLLHR